MNKINILIVIVAVIVINSLSYANCQAHAGEGNFGGSKNQGGLWEPTLGFIRQNVRLIQSYVALMRSIFVGSYDRPLITSTDAPRVTATRGPIVPIGRTRI